MLLARIAKSLTRKAKQVELSVVDEAIWLNLGGKRPRGEWTEQKIDSITDACSVIVGTRKDKKVITGEDVSKLASNELPMKIVRAEHGSKFILRKVKEEPVSNESEVLEDYLSFYEELQEKQTTEAGSEVNGQGTGIDEHQESVMDEVE